MFYNFSRVIATIVIYSTLFELIIILLILANLYMSVNYCTKHVPLPSEIHNEERKLSWSNMLNTQPLFGEAHAHEDMKVSEKFCCEDRHLFMFNPVLPHIV